MRDAGLESAGRPGVVTYSPKVFIPLTRLCRDRCHYCTFATVPGRLPAPFLSPDEVLDIARRGAELGCKEALFTLGDRPEDRWPDAREWLESRGYDSTVAYVRAMAIAVLEETGLLPHLNPGVMSWAELNRLKPVAPSMGLMLESTSRAADRRGGRRPLRLARQGPRGPAADDRGRRPADDPVHHRHPGRHRRDAARPRRLDHRHPRGGPRYGHVQEVIVQNFRAKPDTAMRNEPDADADGYLATVAVARLLLGPAMRVQAPPNLSEPAESRGCSPRASTTGAASAR